MGKRVGKTNRRDRRLLYPHWDDSSPAGESWETVCFSVTPSRAVIRGTCTPAPISHWLNAAENLGRGEALVHCPAMRASYIHRENGLCAAGCRGSSRHRDKGAGSCKFSGSILKDRGQGTRVGAGSVCNTPPKHALEISKTSGSESLRNLRGWFSLSRQSPWDFSTEHSSLSLSKTETPLRMVGGSEDISPTPAPHLGHSRKARKARGRTRGRKEKRRQEARALNLNYLIKNILVKIVFSFINIYCGQVCVFFIYYEVFLTYRKVQPCKGSQI